MADDFHIDDSNAGDLLADPQHKRGRVPGDYHKVPHGSMPFAPAFDLPLIDRKDWARLAKKMEDEGTRLSDIRGDIPSLNQDGFNTCWAHAPASAMILIRALMNQPRVRFSPMAVAALVKNFSDPGGWGGEAVRFIVENGIPDEQFWPDDQMDPSFVTPEMKADAAKHKIAGWSDLLPRDFDQLATCLLNGWPVAVGYDWWSHEVCACDLVFNEDTGEFGVRIWNSWGDTWGERGMGVLWGHRAVPDDAVALRNVT